MTLTLPAETEVRLQTLAVQRNQAPEAVIDAALEALLREMPAPETPSGSGFQEEPETEEECQTRLHAVLAQLLAKAHEIVPEPYDSPARTYYRETEFGKIVAEKFRKQGFDI